MNNICALFIFCLLACFTSQAQKLMNSTLSGGGSTKQVNGRYISQVVGQMSVAGTFKNGSLTVRQGFKQPGMSFSFRTQPIASSTNIIKDSEMNITFTVFPNPFMHRFTVSFSDVVDVPTQLSLYDMAGNSVFEKVFPNLVKEVEVNNIGYLRTGQYILHITQNGKPTTITLIKDL
jgi:hypothetical protein